MGESKRRRASGETNGTPPADKLPNFIFGRRKDIERDHGFLLAGTPVTDIPKGTKPNEDDNRRVAEII
jgi:hypothetical protein